MASRRLAQPICSRRDRRWENPAVPRRCYAAACPLNVLNVAVYPTVNASGKEYAWEVGAFASHFTACQVAAEEALEPGILPLQYYWPFLPRVGAAALEPEQLVIAGPKLL